MNRALAYSTSLKHDKSSALPPPLPIIIRSASVFCAVSSAFIKVFGAVTPCTVTGMIITLSIGLRRDIIFSISCKAALFSAVMIHTVFGCAGISRFLEKYPPASSSRFAFSKARASSPSPFSIISLTYI